MQQKVLISYSLLLLSLSLNFITVELQNSEGFERYDVLAFESECLIVSAVTKFWFYNMLGIRSTD